MPGSRCQRILSGRQPFIQRPGERLTKFISLRCSNHFTDRVTSTADSNPFDSLPRSDHCAFATVGTYGYPFVAFTDASSTHKHRSFVRLVPSDGIRVLRPEQ
jgi:hypothetical protein